MAFRSSRLVRSARRRRVAIAAGAAPALGLLVLSTGCGVPISATPQVLGGMPAVLIQPRTKFQAPPKEPVEQHSFDVYFVANDAHGQLLIGVTRAGPPTPKLALRYLELGPDNVEQQSGITTAIPTDEGASVVHIEKKRTAVVNLNFGALSPLGVAQIVWTLTVPPVKSVLFLEAGQPVHVPIGSGRSVSRPVTRADYPNFAPA